MVPLDRDSVGEDEMSLSQRGMVRGLRQTGLKSGDVVLAHSGMRAFGRIEGGAETVVAAILEVLGERGTLSGPELHFRSRS